MNNNTNKIYNQNNYNRDFYEKNSNNINNSTNNINDEHQQDKNQKNSNNNKYLDLKNNKYFFFKYIKNETFLRYQL